MNRTVAALSLLLIGMAAFIVVQARRVPPRLLPTAAAPAVDTTASAPEATPPAPALVEGEADLVSVRSS